MKALLKGIAFVSLLVSAAAISYGDIRWIDRDYDFGLMKEVAGPKTGYSRFVNLGPDTISVLDVKPSCGCTSADFTDTPIAPGDTAVISYTYDPTRRPGRFLKTVKVRLNDNSRHQIVIQGNVLGTPESLSVLYPVEAGQMRLSDPALNAGDIKFGRSPILFVNAYSMPTDSISPALKAEAPFTEAVSISASQPKAGPGDIITFSINLDTRTLGEYGPVEIPLTFRADPADPVTATIPLRAFIVPDGAMLSKKQGNRHPECEITPDIIDIGEISGNFILRQRFTVSNTGSAPLEILRVYTDSPAIKIAKVPKTVKAGKHTDIEIEIDTSKVAEGPSKPAVTVITDDPRTPVLTLPIPIYRN